MNAKTIGKLQFLQRQAASLLLYQNVVNGEVGQAFLILLEILSLSSAGSPGGVEGLNCQRAYGRWFRALAAKNCSWQDYLIYEILRDDNPFTKQAQLLPLTRLPPALIAAAQQDLEALQSLYECTSDHLSRWVQEAAGVQMRPVAWVQQNDEGGAIDELPLQKQKKWADTLPELSAYYRQYGTGLFAEYRAFSWKSGKLSSILHPDPVRLRELVGYEFQREALLKNTEFLLAGLPALHVLLYGSRGTGKSSLVKALLNEYRERGLRLIEVSKSALKDLPIIVEQLRGIAHKFIIFVDDLSFEEDDDAFKALKVVLEGNVTARPQNVVVYATSNRRHLIREFFDDRPRPRDGDEVHAWDTVQEKLSFSDRFGLTLTFEPANQDNYLQIVRHLAAIADIPLTPEDLEYRALQWATRHNGRSGRTARQFVDFLKAELTLYPQ